LRTTAPQRDLAVRLVRGEHDVGVRDACALAPFEHAPQRRAAELRREQLRREIVVVEDDAPAQRAREQREREERVGRVVEVDDATPAQQRARPARVQLHVREHVLEHEPAPRRWQRGQAKALDLHAADALAPALARRPWRDHAHSIPGANEPLRLAANAHVRRVRIVLEQHSYSRATGGSGAS
jgi:hypothetical protein